MTPKPWSWGSSPCSCLHLPTALLRVCLLPQGAHPSLLSGPPQGRPPSHRPPFPWQPRTHRWAKTFRGCTTWGDVQALCPTSLILPCAGYACYDPRKFGEGQITAMFTTACLKQHSGCSGHSFSKMGAGLGLWGCKDISAQGLRVRSQEGLPGLSARRGNGDSKAWECGMTGWVSLGEEGWRRAAQEQPPPLPGPCRLLSGSATGREMPLGKTKVERPGNFQPLPSAILPRVSHQPRGPGGKDLFLRPPAKALASKLSCQILGLGEPLVRERSAATGNEGGRSWEAVGGWGQGGRVAPQAVAFNLGCTLKSPDSF